MWQVYIVECIDKSLYCGITKDIVRRIYQHNNTKQGAKYTRSRRPVVLLWNRKISTRSQASSLEAAIKKLSRKKKLEIISKNLSLEGLIDFLQT